MNKQVYSRRIDVESKAQRSDCHLGSLRELAAECVFDVADWSLVFSREWVGLKYNSHNAQRPLIGSGHRAKGQGRLIIDNLLARWPLPMFLRFPVPALPPVCPGWEGSFTDGMGMGARPGAAGKAGG